MSVDEVRTVLKLSLPMLLCAACAPAGDSRENAVSSSPRSYATQERAPSPNYQALLSQPTLPFREAAERKVTSLQPADAKVVGDRWLARLKERGALLGYGLGGKSPDGPVMAINTGLTKDEFDSWVRQNGWDVPGHIRWSFVPALNLSPVSDAAKDAIRFWPASTARTGAQHQALLAGRVYLRDGCFFVSGRREAVDKLAWFHAEVGFDVDDEGYFVLRDRLGGQILTRLGEDMNWGGPPSAVIDPKAEQALHEACGPGDITVVGSPEARERFVTQYPHMREPRVPPPPPPPSPAS